MQITGDVPPKITLAKVKLMAIPLLSRLPLKILLRAKITTPSRAPNVRANNSNIEHSNTMLWVVSNRRKSGIVLIVILKLLTFNISL